MLAKVGLISVWALFGFSVLLDARLIRGNGALQVEVTREASCKESQRAEEGDQVTVHYGGFLQDGKKFDSSFDRSTPFTFKLGVGQVIPGWDQGLLGVCRGEERHLVVPAPLAYGDKGAGDVIPPGATLLFDIVIIDVEKAGEAEEKKNLKEEEESRGIELKAREEEEERRKTEMKAREEEKERRRLSALKAIEVEEEIRRKELEAREEEEERRKKDLKAREEEKERRRLDLIAREEEEARRQADKIAREEEESRRQADKIAREEEEARRQADKIAREDELKRREDEELRRKIQKEEIAEEKKRQLEDEIARKEEEMRREEEILRREQEEKKKQDKEAQESQRRKEEEYEDYYYYDYGPESTCEPGELKIQVISKPRRCPKKAVVGDQLTMHYTGKLSTGAKFDSSVDRDKPFQFSLGVGQVIAGWDQGLLGMCEGERRTLVIPPDLAYGEQGVGAVIPACSVLVFDVELIDIA